MGGNTPMGYDVVDRELIVNEKNAETVRHIFRRYVDLGTVNLLHADLLHDGITSPVRIARSTERQSGGRPLARGALYHMLQNRIYLGEIVHKDASYSGKHNAIIDPELWDKVQATLQANRVKRRNGTDVKHPSLLAGLLYDGHGNRFTASHAVKNGRRYRYYIATDDGASNTVGGPPPRRIPAGDVEGLVAGRLQAFFGDDKSVHDAALSAIDDLTQQASLLANAKRLADRWPNMQPHDLRSLITGTVTRIKILEDRLDIQMDPKALCQHLRDLDVEHIRPSPPATTPSHNLITLTVAVKLKRCGMEMKLIVADRSIATRAGPDLVLITALVKANSWWNKLASGEAKSIRDLATQVGTNERYVAWILRLKHLAPDMIGAILDGRQPPEWTADTFIKARKFPYQWDEQRRQFGFTSRC